MNPLRHNYVARDVLLTGGVQLPSARDKRNPLVIIGFLFGPDDGSHIDAVAVKPVVGNHLVLVVDAVFHFDDDGIADGALREIHERRRDAVVVDMRGKHRVAAKARLGVDVVPADVGVFGFWGIEFAKGVNLEVFDRGIDVESRNLEACDLAIEGVGVAVGVGRGVFVAVAVEVGVSAGTDGVGVAFGSSPPLQATPTRSTSAPSANAPSESIRTSFKFRSPRN